MIDSLELVISRGTIVTPRGRFQADIGVRNGIVSCLGIAGSLAADRVIDAHGLLVLPGVIDAHVHFRDPGFPDAEDFESGSRAAAFGGVTTVFDMPNTSPAVLTAEGLESKRLMAESKSWVDFGLYAALDPSNIDRAAELASAGAIAFKVFMYERASPPPRGIVDDDLLRAAFCAAASAGLVLAVHAENESLVRAATDRVARGEAHDALAHLHSRPDLAESEAISRAALFARQAGARLHVCHLSSEAGAIALRTIRSQGFKVTAETTPQHLLLDASMYERLGPLMKMVPPIRSKADSEALWSAIGDGTVGMVATDHAPHPEVRKVGVDIKSAASGIIGVETMLPLMFTQVAAGRLALERMVLLLSEAPAKTFDLWPKKGALELGSDADCVLLDPEARWTIHAAELHSRSRATPFEGCEVVGRVVSTLVRGTQVVADGSLRERPRAQMVCRFPTGAAA